MRRLLLIFFLCASSQKPSKLLTFLSFNILLAREEENFQSNIK